MADQEMNGMNMDESEDLVVFEDEEGQEFVYQVDDYFFYNGEEYAILTEASDEEAEEERVECIVCKVITEEDEEEGEVETFELVEDEELAEKLVEVYNTKLAEEEDE